MERGNIPKEPVLGTSMPGVTKKPSKTMPELMIHLWAKYPASWGYQWRDISPPLPLCAYMLSEAFQKLPMPTTNLPPGQYLICALSAVEVEGHPFRVHFPQNAAGALYRPPAHRPWLDPVSQASPRHRHSKGDPVSQKDRISASRASIGQAPSCQSSSCLP